MTDDHTRSENPLELILVHNHKGGTGKTTLAVHIAEFLALRGQRWCFYDADRQANGISWLSGHKWTGEPRIEIPAGTDRAELVVFSEAGPLRDTVSEGLVNHLIVDTPPADDSIRNIVGELSEFIRLTPEDIVVCPVNGRFAIDGAIKVAEEVQPSGCRIVLVPNLTDPREGHAREEIRAIEDLAAASDLNVEVFRLAIPRNQRYMRDAELKGVPVWDLPYAQQTHTVRALTAFCQWIADGAPREANVRRDLRPPSAPSYAISRTLSRRLWND